MRLLHFGFKVHDIERTMRAYEDLVGIKWDPIAEHVQPPSCGRRGPQRSRVTHGFTDDGVEIELVQTVEGVAVDDAVLGDREGISHVAFLVDDLAAERARVAAKGVEIVSEGTAPRASWIFLKDEGLGGALVQLVQLNKQPE